MRIEQDQSNSPHSLGESAADTTSPFTETLSFKETENIILPASEWNQFGDRLTGFRDNDWFCL